MGRITDLSEEAYRNVYDTLSDSRRTHIDRMKTADARRRSLLATRLLSSLLAKRGQPNVLLETDADGKPFLSGSDLFVSISHSDEVVVCAVDDSAVGIDVEKIRPVDRKLITYVCTERELAYVLQDETDIPCRFFEVWTAKEAAYKHDGGSTPLRAIETLSRSKQQYVIDGYYITVI